jgi:tetratricopeptide (TPR) repeat protein
MQPDQPTDPNPQAIAPVDDDSPELVADETPRRGRLFGSSVLLVLIVLCVIAVALGLAGAGGLLAGQNQRGAYATQTTAAGIDEQYALGVSDLEAGNYTLAAERFRWVLSVAPDYPGAADHLAEAEQQAAATEAPDPTEIPPSEADTLGERLAEARTLYEDEEWAAAIQRLQELQALDPTYEAADVKQMLYDALKTLGLEYVRGEREEEGIFLLDQASAIQPLDDQTEGERLIATFYITASTYWGLNWPVVITNLEEIYRVAPYYRDVEDRLYTAYVSYAEQNLPLEGGPCNAAELYQGALNIRFDAEINNKLELATDYCENPTPTPTATEGPPPTEAEGEGDAVTTPEPGGDAAEGE